MKRLKFRKKTLLILGCLIAILGIILAAPSITRGIKELTANRTVKYDGIQGYEYSNSTLTLEDDNIGTWNFKATFSGSNFETFNSGSQIIYDATNNNLADNRVDITYTVTYQANSSSYDIDYGELAFSIPNMIFGLNLASGFTKTYNSTTNEILITSGDTVVAKVALGDLALYDYSSPGASGAKFGADNYYVNTGEILVCNDDIIAKDQSLDYSIVVSYYFIPQTFVNGEINDLESYFSIYNADSDTFIDGSLHLITQLQYGENGANFTKQEAVLYEEWQSAWGENNLTGTNYYFMEYGVESELSASTPYQISFSLDNRDGTIVAFGDGTTYISGGNWMISSDPLIPDNSTFASIDTTLTANTEVERKVVIAYEKPEPQHTKETNFSIVISIGEKQKTVTWSSSYFNDGTVTLEYPEGISSDIVERVTNNAQSTGALNRIENNTSFGTTMLIEADTNSINKDSTGTEVKAFNVWNLTNNGTEDVAIELITTGLYLDSSYATDVNLTGLDTGDYKIVSMYPADDREYNYVEGTDKYVLSENDQYSVYTSKKVYARVGGEYTYVGSYKKDTTGIIFTNTEGSRVVTATSPIVLPEDTTDVKVLYEGNKSAVYLGYYVNYVVNPSDNVKSIISNLSNGDIVLKGKSRSYINNEQKDSDGAGTYLTRLSSSSYLNVAAENTGKQGENDVISYNIHAYEQVTSNGDSELAKSVINKQEEATYYVLLPKGLVLGTDLSVSNYRGSAISNFTYEVSNNYYDGRNLLIVHINNDDNNYYVTTNYVQYGYSLSFTGYYGLQANQTYGVNLNADVIYTSDDLSDGYDTLNEVLNSEFTSNGVKAGLSDVELYNRLMVGKSTVVVESVTVTEGRFNKIVDTTSVPESKSYTYTLQYTPSSSYDRISNLLFVDKIESADTDGNYFKGLLSSVDTSYLNGKGIATTVYYTTSDIDLDHIDINSSVWTTTMPADRETIKAIAVSTGSSEFSASSGISPRIDIKLVAPNSYVAGRTLKAKNQAIIKYVDFYGANALLRSDITSVELKKADIIVDVNYRATANGVSEGKGTATNPIVISGDYGYYLTIKNNDSNNVYDNIKLVNILPEDIDLNGAIQILDEAQAERVTITTSNRNLNVDIASINKNETIALWIPVHLTNEDNGSVFDNVVSMTKLSNKDYDGEKVHVYTKASVPVLDYNKYVKTASSGTYAKDEVFILESNETYSYKISVANTSTIDSTGITLVDNVPEGLSVNTATITNSGSYDSTNRTITWTFDLAAGESINVSYSVTLASDAELGTYYTSNAHITMANPLNTSVLLYDVDTNNVSTYYQVVSDIAINNSVTGVLGNKDKEFSYTISLDGPASYVGSYDVLNKERTKIGTLSIDSDGKASYTFKLKDSEGIVIKLLPGNIDYTITQEAYSGYVTSNSENQTRVIEGRTETSNATYNYANSYSASTSTSLGARVVYDKGLSEGLFKLQFVNGDEVTDKLIDSEGNVNFGTLSYANEVGTYTYQIKQVALGVPQIVYDNQVYTVNVIVTDKGDGTLNAQVKYYNGANEEVSEAVFTNEYVPFGLTVVNSNTSKYIDPSKVFVYTISISNAESGEYTVLKNNSEELDPLVVDDTGVGSLNVNLKSNDKITIVDLSNESNYVVSQQKIAYYETSVSDGSEIDNLVTASGSIQGDSAQVVFENVYNTTATFTPLFMVVLEENEIESDEFTFVLKDVSSGSTNGYTETKTNDELGSIDFSTITFDRPGTYTYHIDQVKGSSNHIYYDLSRCVLTLVLSDNEDGTMDVEYDYHFNSGNREFINRYSVDPIYVEPDPVDPNKEKNPNTIDYIIVVLLGLVLIFNIIVIQRKTRVSKFS